MYIFMDGEENQFPVTFDVELTLNMKQISLFMYIRFKIYI